MNFIQNETAQKLRGGYYTPLDLSEFIIKWVKEKSPRSILEPSCGDGVFFHAMARVKGLRKSHLLGFELNADEAAKARNAIHELYLTNATVQSEDFLGWALNNMGENGRRFDAVVGNPPFVRYQYLPENFQQRAAGIFSALDLPFTKHTNAWVPFILSSVALLNPGGRLAMVVPAEILHVTHAQSLRRYLGQACSRLVIIDPEELWFQGTLQGAVILLAEKKNRPRDASQGVGIYQVKGREFLKKAPADIFLAPQAINGKTVSGKWTRALLDKETRSLIDELEQHEDVHRFVDVADVDVGIVTGANKFFLVPDATVKEHGLQEWAHPMFGRSQHCPGVIYDEQQHERNVADGLPTNFLWFRGEPKSLGKKPRKYIEIGEQESLHSRYKCRIRSPWYTVPSVYTTEIGMLKRSHDVPRLILNRLGAYTTDTAYRITSHCVKGEKLVACFINPLTALSAEIESRHYGGGVMELIPSEIEKLLIPIPKHSDLDIAKLDHAVRSKNINHVMRHQGESVLGPLGISKAQQDCLVAGWQKLRDRRHRASADTDQNEDPSTRSQ